MSCLLLILNLCIGYRSKTLRTPVDDTFASVNKSLFVKTNENLFNSLVTALVHSKALTLPVCRRTNLAKLFYNTSAVLFFPFPCTLKEFFTSDVLFGDTLLTHSLNNFSLGCDRSVVCAGKPQCAVSLHSFKSDKNILQGIVECVTHMELTCDVRRRHNDSIRLFILVYLCVKKAVIHPKVIYSVFKLCRLISLSKLFSHNFYLRYFVLS